MSAELLSILPPCPQTKRGYGIQVHSNSKSGQFVYCNGKNVVLRSLANLKDCDLFAEHKCNVSVAKFSPNGEWIASGDTRGRVLVWSVKTKMIKFEVNVCRDVLDISWSDDGKRIVAVGDGTDTFAKAFMWDSGNTVGDITNHSKSILSCDIRQTRPYRVVTCSEDKQINFYTGPPFRFEKMIDRHTRFPNQVRFSPDGSFFVSVGSDKKIFVFDGKTGEFVRELQCAENGHTGSIWSFDWSPDSIQILTVSGDSTAKIWDVQTSKVVSTFTFPGADDGTNSHQQVGALWHDKDTMLTVELSGAINILNPEDSTKPKQQTQGHSVALSAFAVDRQAKIVYSGDAQGTVFRWAPLTGKVEELTSVGDGAKNIATIAVSSKNVFSAAFDDVLRITDISAGAINSSGTPTGGQPVQVAVSEDGSLVILVTRKKQLICYVNGAQSSCLDLAYLPSGVALSPDNARVAVSGDKTVHLYTVTNGQLAVAQTLVGHNDPTTCVAYSPDGKFLATADGQRYIYVWSTSDNKAMNPTGWRYHNAKVCSISFSPDSSKLASASIDQVIFIWTDLVEFDSNRIKIDPAHVGGVSGVEFLDNQHIVSCGDDRAVKYWKLPA